MRPSWTVLGLVAVAALALPAPAQALPAAKPPTSKGLAAAGVKLTWPVKQATTAARPGQRFTVRVHRGSKVARVRLVRVTSGKGAPIRVVRQRRLRSGALTVTLPATAPATYALQVTAGKRTFHNWITVPAPRPAPQPAPAPAPAPAPQPRTHAELYCGRPDGMTVAVTVARVLPEPEPVPAGTIVGYAVTNTGDVCLVSPNGEAALERLTDAGTWELVRQTTPDGLPLGPPIQPWAAWRQGAVVGATVGVPPDAVPGTYRASISVRTVEPHRGVRPSGGPLVPFVSPTFEVVAKPQPEPEPESQP